MSFLIVRDDLASLSADALVVTANEDLRIEGTVGAALAEVAGLAELQAACDAIGHCSVGGAVLTPAFAAPARHIVHAVGPIWQGGAAGEAELLAATVRRVLRLAWDAGDRSIAMPLVSAGTNGFPVREALEIHTEAISDFLDDHDMAITLALYDRRAVIAGTELELDVQAYIDDVYVDEHQSGSSSPFLGNARRMSRPFRHGARPMQGPPDLDGAPLDAERLRRMEAQLADLEATALEAEEIERGESGLADSRPMASQVGASASVSPKRRKRHLPWRRKRRRKDHAEPSEGVASGRFSAPHVAGAPAPRASWVPPSPTAAPAPTAAPTPDQAPTAAPAPTAPQSPTAAPAASPTAPQAPAAAPAPAQAPAAAPAPAQAAAAPAAAPSLRRPPTLADLENRVAHLDLSFSQTLLHLIDLAGKTDAEVYKRANISRQLFSKIRSDAQYRPTKKTAVAFAVALELSLDETEDLLERAGFALSHARLFDVIVEYFIELGVYDIFTINEVLYAYDQELLGS